MDRHFVEDTIHTNWLKLIREVFRLLGLGRRDSSYQRYSPTTTGNQCQEENVRDEQRLESHRWLKGSALSRIASRRTNSGESEAKLPGQ